MALNVRLLKKVRDAVARTRSNTKQKFSMRQFVTLTNGVSKDLMGTKELQAAMSDIRKRECGTVACIAGFTCLVAGEKALGNVLDMAFDDAAADLLCISREDAQNLFYGEWKFRAWDSTLVAHLEGITKREALDYLDECIEARAIVRR